jgi:2-dehydro-3-deoxyphosphogluconate aldolase/(4S)-4-hydroxy-2-oxoglutarate aldolase
VTVGRTEPAPARSELDPLLASGVIAVLRLAQATGLEDVARALAAGGVGAVEVTLTTPGAIDAIRRLVADKDLGGCVVGAGTVLDRRAAREVVKAGARFVVSPTLDLDVLSVCRDHDLVCMPGAFTPTEILAAWRAGAPVVKLFPAGVAGPGYLRDVLAPLPFLRVVPSGGVSLDNAGEWIRAGAAAVSVGTALVGSAALRGDGGAGLAARARALVERVADARGRAAQGDGAS